MFKTKRKLLNEQAKVKNRDKLIEDLENKIEQLQDENKKLKLDLEEEKIENYNQHTKLFKIEKLLNKPYGTYRSLLSFRNSIEKELARPQNQN